MKKIVFIVVATLFLVTATGFSTDSSGLQQGEVVKTVQESWGLIIVEQGKGADANKTFLKIANETGEGICVHANVYIDGEWVGVYGYVPAWANTKKKATYIYWSYSSFGLGDVDGEDYHTDNICPKMKTSQY